MDFFTFGGDIFRGFQLEGKWYLSGDRSSTASANNNYDGPPCSLPHRRRRIGESSFITTNMDDHHNEDKRTEQNLTVRSSKPEAEVNKQKISFDVLYYWS